MDKEVKISKEGFGVPEKDRVPVKEKLAYSLGFAGKDAVQVIINSFVFVYLMEIVGINFAYIGGLMLQPVFLTPLMILLSGRLPIIIIRKKAAINHSFRMEVFFWQSSLSG